MSVNHNQAVPVLKVLRDLDTGIEAHAAWLKQFHRAVACGTPPNADDLNDDAHHLCTFGRWLYADEGEILAQWPDLRKGIESTHESMHNLARALFIEQLAKQPLNPSEYDKFMDAATLFKSEVRATQFRVMADVCLVDHLTGAWNRNSMFQKLAEEHERMVRHKQSCCLCMMDIDHFKHVNDRYGHAAGDKVLHLAVDHVAEYLRKYDTVFRYGGEEFLLCLPNISADAAVIAMDRIRAGLETLAISLPGGETISITASFGVAPISVDLSIEENINVADQALFCAKVGGRNRVCLWGENRAQDTAS